jgi:hypothetical protein
MKHYTRVQTISENNYVVGERWDDERTISDITIDDDVPESVDIWASTDNQERRVAMIPYHAVELLVK